MISANGMIYLNPDEQIMYENYLAHHGIKGQKWGQRRFQNADGSLTNSGRQRYGVIERTKIRAQGLGQRIVTPFKKAHNAKGVGNKISELAGYGQMKTSQDIKAETQRKLADASRTRFGKHIHNVSAQNHKYGSEYASKMRKADMSDKFIENFVFRKEWVNTPHTRISGRTTTRGKEAVDWILTGGAVGLAKDVGHLAGKSTIKRAERKNKRIDKKTSGQKLTAGSNVSKTTQRAINDWNSMDNKQFQKKYKTDKKTYQKRVEKYGDPYMNAPLAKMGKALAKKKR